MGNQLAKARAKRRNKSSEVVEAYTPEEIAQKFDLMPRLTAEEIEVVQHSWERVIRRKMDKVGRTAFAELFTAYPDTQNVFRKFHAEDVRVLRAGSDLLQHGQIVCTLVQKVVQNLDNYHTVWEVLLKSGRSHFHHGALPMYLDKVGSQFVLAIRKCIGSDWEERFEYHYLALFDMIVYGMKFGWNLQRVDEQIKAARLSKEATVKSSDKGKNGKKARSSLPSKNSSE